MGPSGVGKTETLRRTEPALRDRRYFQEDLSFFLDEAFMAPPERQAFHERLAYRRLCETFAQTRYLAARSARAAYLLSVLNADLAMVSQEYPKGFFVHDGLCHNFGSVLLEMLREGDRNAENLVRSRNYVFLLAEETGTVVRNILKRREAMPGFRTNNFPTLSAADLETMSRDTNRVARELAKRFADLSANVLVLSAGDGWELNGDSILRFEQDLLAHAGRKPHGRDPAVGKQGGLETESAGHGRRTGSAVRRGTA